jgi:hypothetical protein
MNHKQSLVIVQDQFAIRVRVKLAGVALGSRQDHA